MSKPRPITLKLDLTKILKEHLFKGAKGTYLDLVVWPNKDGAGQYGDTHYVVQEINKAARDAGERGPIIGNAKVPEVETSAPAPRQQQTRQRPPVRENDNFGDTSSQGMNAGMAEEDVPF
jgi:hypothetical protein